MPTRGVLLLALLGALAMRPSPALAPDAKPPSLEVHSIALPGAPPEGVFMDYIAYDRAHGRVWVPAGNTGSVDVVQVSDDRVTRIEGFPTADIEREGVRRKVGPSSATVGEGFVYVGNRADNSVCAVDSASLRRGACLTLAAMPDGLAYVAATKELWVTTPRDASIAVVDAAAPGALTSKARIGLPGQPEGFAVDDARGLFFTNLEDKDRTLVIDLKTRQVKATWQPGCGAEGPRGLSLDPGLDFLFVACTTRLVVLDAGHEGKTLAKLEVGDGVDNIDYLPARRELYAAAGRAGRLTIAKVDGQGALSALASVATAPGARNAVATEAGKAYVTDSRGGRILAVVPVGAR